MILTNDLCTEKVKKSPPMEDPNLARTDGALYTAQIADSIKEGSGYRLEKMVIAEFGCLFRQSKISARIQ